MVVMTVISLIAGVVGININKSVQEQRFRSEVGQVLDKLRLAQNFMLISGEEVKVHFKNAEGGIEYWLSFQCPAPTGWDREMTRKSTVLTGIRRVEFDGAEKESANGELSLKFLSGGMVMSRGVLKLSTGEGRSYNDQRYICLQGFPAPITSGAKNSTSCFKGDLAHANDQMTQFIMPEIINKIQAQKSQNRNQTLDDNENKNPLSNQQDEAAKAGKGVKPKSVEEE